MGTVSEGDIIGRDKDKGQRRRDWGLALVAEGEPLHRDFLASFEAAEQRRVRVKELIDHHVDEPAWQAMLHKVRHAAQEGEAETLIFTFPASLCSHGRRATNLPETDWPRPCGAKLARSICAGNTNCARRASTWRRASSTFPAACRAMSVCS